MANKPGIANDLAFQNLLSENQRKYEDLRRQQKTISSLPRTVKVNRLNKYVVVNPESTSERFKTGFVPVNSVSFSPLSFTPRATLSSSRRGNLRRLQTPRLASLSERTFRKPPGSGSKNVRYRLFSGTGMPRTKSAQGFRRTVSERVLKTTDTWLPSLKSTNLGRMERPFLRPLNAIEQILNNEIVEPTANYFNDFKVYVNTKIGSSFPVIYKSNQITELVASEAGSNQPEVPDLVEGTSQGQGENTGTNGNGNRRQSLGLGQRRKSDGRRKYSRKAFRKRNQPSVVLHAVSHFGNMAKGLARKLKLDRLANFALGADNTTPIDDYVEAVCKSDHFQASRDTINALRREPPAYIVMSACLSFQFGPPIKPYSPIQNCPQVAMTPLLSLHLGNLRLSPGKEIYMADTIDITDLRSERMKSVLRVRFSLNDYSAFHGDRLMTLRSARDTDDIPASLSNRVFPDMTFPVSSVLVDDPDLKSYILPLNSYETLLSPSCLPLDRIQGSAETFSEFGYQVLGSAQVVGR